MPTFQITADISFLDNLLNNSWLMKMHLKFNINVFKFVCYTNK